MTDDISEIPATGCNILSSPTTINNYSNGVRKTFYQLGGKWIYASQQQYTNLPNNAVCVDVSVFNSNSAFEPVYYGISFLLLVCVIYLWYSVIRKVIKWRKS